MSLNRLASLAVLASLSFSAAAYAQQAITPPAAPSADNIAAEDTSVCTGNGQSTTATASAPYGSTLFTENQSANNTVNAPSPAQKVAKGDNLHLAVWGATTADLRTSVDSKGEVYIPEVGTVKVEGVSNDKLSSVIRQQIGKIFKNDVQVYASIEQHNGVPVLVTGSVNRPGQYWGGSNDSVVVYLQKAGGIAEHGSYRDIHLMRQGHTENSFDLYPFLRSGTLANVSWQPGDIVVIGEQKARVNVTGAVKNCNLFDFKGATSGADILLYAAPQPEATHVMISGFREHKPYAETLTLEAFARTTLQDGDQAYFYSGQRRDQITVRVEGQTDGNPRFVVPVNAKLDDVLDQIAVDPQQSDINSIYIKRISVAKVQKDSINASLYRLEQSVLTAPAQSDAEASIRAKEAELVHQFVQKAQAVPPDGRVVVFHDGKRMNIALENNDVIVIPRRTDVAFIEGEVMLPHSVVAQPGLSARDYISLAGGFTERAEDGEFMVMRPNGEAFRADNPEIMPGDRLFVMPHVDSKFVQSAKEITQILYQIAVGAGVLLKL